MSRFLGEDFGSIMLALLYSTIISMVTCQPYVSVDWSAAGGDKDDQNVASYTVDYFPGVGKPQPPIRLPPSALQTEISDTLPATMYTVAVIAELMDRRRSIIFNSTLPSSPEPPSVDTIDTKATEIKIQLFPPDIDDITYLANYSLTSSPDAHSSKSFAQPTITLNDLNAGSEYNIFIFTVFNGAYSHRPCRLTVKTLASLSSFTKDFGHSPSLAVSSVSSMLPSSSPSPILSSTEASTSSTMTPSDTATMVDETSTSTVTDSTNEPDSVTRAAASSTTARQMERPRTILIRTQTPPMEQPTRQDSAKHATDGSSWKPSPLPLTAARKHGPAEEPEALPTNPTERHDGAGDGNMGRKKLLGAIAREQPPVGETGNEEEEEKDGEELESEEARVRTSSAANKKGRAKLINKPSTNKESSPNSSSAVYNFTSSLPPEIMAKLPDSYGRPKSVEFSPEGRQLRLSWHRPEGTECSGYFVNYTLTTLHVPKSFHVFADSGRTYAFIKMYLNNIIQVEVYCIQNDTIVSKTPGRAIVDLRKPEPVKNLRVADILTDDFFRSSISLEWDWPSNHSYDVDMYSIIVSYYPGKAKKLKSQTLIVNETGPLNISGLKPTETYTFSVKNISRLNIESAAKGFKQIMPPVIASTLLPGEVTSTSLLITYSPTDVDEARFDSYQMVACFSESVNKTFVKAKADANRNFLLKNLVPGQTYSFYLYTVYKKVRSKPVAANFTTYPLKVKNLFAIVRRNAVKLFYEPEESPLKEIRYRLSFTGSDGSESDSVTLLNQREYVFDYLKPEIWYTFSVTVLMGEQESESTARTIVTGLNSDPVPHLRGSTPTTIDIAFRRDIFTESNGIIQNYSIIVAEDYRMDYFNYSVLTWRAVQDREVWPPYRATPAVYNPFKDPNDEATTYTIGIDTCSVDSYDESCNGPLKPRTEYFIKLRACTNEQICMETSYTKAATEIDTTPLETRRFLNPYNSRAYQAAVLSVSMFTAFV